MVDDSTTAATPKLRYYYLDKRVKGASTANRRRSNAPWAISSAVAVGGSNGWPLPNRAPAAHRCRDRHGCGALRARGQSGVWQRDDAPPDDRTADGTAHRLPAIRSGSQLRRGALSD